MEGDSSVSALYLLLFLLLSFLYHEASCIVYVLVYLDGDESSSVQEVFPAVGHFSTQTITTRFLPPGRKETNHVNTMEDVSMPNILVLCMSRSVNVGAEHNPEGTAADPVREPTLGRRYRWSGGQSWLLLKHL